MLTILHVISWIIFLGLCVEAGSYLFNAGYVFFVTTSAASYFGLAGLYDYDWGWYLVIIFLMTLVGVLKALMFYLTVRLFYHNNLDLSNPFTATLGRLISNWAYLAFGIGLFSNFGFNYSEWLNGQGAQITKIHEHFGGGDVWLFMGVILLVIANIFKRGIEIQSENELTI
ncbi:DUF2975 domain-containing protein [Flavobacterium sp.]|uniref:DUF2975 domain-containing protein n=1 Tax=Flavobacterium sp. TaxID=239 RepID=UPI0039E33525